MSCFEALQRRGHSVFVTEHRGGIHVKGKGENIQTVWLNGVENIVGHRPSLQLQSFFSTSATGTWSRQHSELQISQTEVCVRVWVYSQTQRTAVWRVFTMFSCMFVCVCSLRKTRTASPQSCR